MPGYTPGIFNILSQTKKYPLAYRTDIFIIINYIACISGSA